MNLQDWAAVPDMQHRMTGDCRRMVVSEKINLMSSDTAFFQRLIEYDPAFGVWPVAVSVKIGEASRLLREAYEAIHAK